MGLPPEVYDVGIFVEGNMKKARYAELALYAVEQLPILIGSPLPAASDNSPRSDPTKKSSSSAALLSTLVPVLIVAFAQLLVFLVLRRTNLHVYAPRTFLSTLDEAEQTPPSGHNGWLDWIPEFLRLRDDILLEKQSLDAYLFLRFFKMIILICSVGVCLTWPILLPVNVTGGGKGKELARFTIGNITNPNRYYVHLFVSWIFLGFVLFTITRETLFYVSLRQAYLLTPWNASRMSSRTVLFTSIPRKQLQDSYLRQIFGSVNRVWIIDDCSTVKDLVEKRDKCATSLEATLVQTAQNAIKARNKKRSQGLTKLRYFGSQGRPSKRTVPLVGTKTDAIHWYSSQLVELQQRIEELQRTTNEGGATKQGAAFVEFETISAAQAAIQATTHLTPLVIAAQSVGTVPDGVIWENLSIPVWEGLIRGLLATTFIVLLTAFWSIPTSFVGVLSNVGDIADKVKFLHWIHHLPDPVLGVIEGLLPSLLLSYLVSLVPLICRFVAYQSGEVTKAHIELKTQEWYFTFQVIQVFLVTTFASGATAVATELVNDPKRAPELLAKRLPKASNFYLSYFIVYGFGQSTKNLMNWSGLFYDKMFGYFDKTPRERYERYTALSGTSWGSWYPKFTNLAIIAISYSCIAPLTLGFATIAFLSLYLVFRYNLFYVLQTSIDTQGRAYAKALQQLTIGIYTSELCLIGLFSLSIRRHGASYGPLILMIIFTVLTVVYHRIMHKELGPLTKTLPKAFARERDHQLASGEQGEEATLLRSDEPREQPSGLLGLFMRFFEPQKYTSFKSNLEMLSHTQLGNTISPMTEAKESTAYQHPTLSSKAPKIWLAKDDLGVTERLMQELPQELEITVEGAWIDDRGIVNFDKGNLKALPVWKEKSRF